MQYLFNVHLRVLLEKLQYRSVSLLRVTKVGRAVYNIDVAAQPRSNSGINNHENVSFKKGFVKLGKRSHLNY